MKNIIAIILIVLSVGLFFLYIKPQYASINNLRAEKATYDSTLAKSKELKTLRDSLTQKYNSISEEDKDKLQNMIPTNFDGVKLALDLNTMASRYGMTIRDVKIDAARETDNQARNDVIAQSQDTPGTFKTASISFSTTGQYQTFIKFLKDMENDEELLDIKKLSIDASTQKDGSSNLEFKVTVNTYYIN